MSTIIVDVTEQEDKGFSNRETIGQIVAGDIRKAEVFKRLGMDFCCGGKKTLTAACAEKGLDEHDVRALLDQVGEQNYSRPDFNKWKLGFLADYIVNQHHSYIKENAPLLHELASKIVFKHGERYPYMAEIQVKLIALLSELLTHMKKEETILFPYIETLEMSNGNVRVGFETVKDPILAMEADHELAGQLMHDIRQLSNGYITPESACNSHKLFLYKLQEFENDLLQHVHLENNILFPKAIQIERG